MTPIPCRLHGSISDAARTNNGARRCILHHSFRLHAVDEVLS
jgi:hypothetical protein